MAQPTRIKRNKEEIVAGLTDKAGKAKAIVFAHYQGMTNFQLEALKKAVKETDAEMLVAKNTLMMRALDQLNLKPEEELREATITLFAYGDPIAPLKAITKSFKEIKLPTIKLGIVEGKVLAESEVVRLSTLPSKEVLLAQLMGTLQSPIYGLHRALNWNIQKLVLTLNTIKETRAKA